jgi:hypothetical protein
MKWKKKTIEYGYIRKIILIMDKNGLLFEYKKRMENDIYQNGLKNIIYLRYLEPNI